MNLKLYIHNSQRAGFTLFEMLLSLAIISILAGTVSVFYIPFQTSVDLDSARAVAVNAARLTQAKARANQNQSAWGFYIQNDKVIIFAGQNFASRASSSDEYLSLPPRLQVQGLNEVVFGAATGAPNATGTIIFTAKNNSFVSISINEEGSITY